MNTADKLQRAAQTALLTIEYALDRVNPEDFATSLNWEAVVAELKSVLALSGHPAGMGVPQPVVCERAYRST